MADAAGLQLLAGILSAPERINNERMQDAQMRPFLRAMGVPENQLPGSDTPTPLGGSGTFGKILSGIGKTGAALSAAMGNPVPAPRPNLGALANLQQTQYLQAKNRQFESAAQAMERGDPRGAGVALLRAGQPGPAVRLLGGGSSDSIRSVWDAARETAESEGKEGKEKIARIMEIVTEEQRKKDAAAVDRATKAAEARGRVQREGKEQEIEKGVQRARELSGGAVPNPLREPGAPMTPVGGGGAVPGMRPKSVTLPLGGGASATFDNPAAKGDTALQNVKAAAGGVASTLSRMRGAIQNGVGSDGKSLLPDAGDMPMSGQENTGLGGVAKSYLGSGAIAMNERRLLNEQRAGNPDAVVITSFEGMLPMLARTFGDVGNISDTAIKMLRGVFAFSNQTKQGGLAGVDNLEKMIEGILANPAAYAKDPSKVDPNAAQEEMKALQEARAARQPQGAPSGGGYDLGDGFQLEIHP